MHDIMASLPQVLLKIASSMAIGMVIRLPMAVIMWWLHRRDQRHWEVHEQVLEMEQQIREQSMAEAWREWHRRWWQRRMPAVPGWRRRSRTGHGAHACDASAALVLPGAVEDTS
jgi:hypothetical protein